MFNCYNIQNFNQLYHGQIQIYLPQYHAPCRRERFRRLCPYPRARLAESALPVRQDRGMEHGQRALCSGIPIQRFQHEGVVYSQRERGEFPRMKSQVVVRIGIDNLLTEYQLFYLTDGELINARNVTDMSNILGANTFL